MDGPVSTTAGEPEAKNPRPTSDEKTWGRPELIGYQGLLNAAGRGGFRPSLVEALVW